MMSRQLLAVFTLLLPLCCSAQEAAKIANAEQEIRALETIRLKSPSKTDAWSGNVAKDALFQLPNGSVASKQDLLTHMQHQGMEDSVEMSDTMFSQIGEAAIFSYVFRRTHHGDGPDTHQHLRRTLVYQHIGSGWQMIASAVAIIPYADLEAKPVDRKILNTYLGVWSVAPTSATITLTLEGGKLMAQASDDTEKYEFQALSDSMFVMQGDPKLVTFEKGPDGKVTRLIFRDVGGSVDVYQRFDRKYR